MYKLLIVDDEYIERCALKFIVENNCHRISLFEEASNGREAIVKAASFQPDIMIIDIKMPGINGIEASREIKKIVPDCRIVFLTAFDYFDYAQEAIKIGVEDFIVKPAPNEQVIGIIDRIVDSLDKQKAQVSRQAELENRLEQIKSYLENELVFSIVAGDIEESQIKEYLSAMGVEFKRGFGAVLIINYDSYTQKVTSSLQKNMIKKRCMEKIDSAIRGQGFYCIMSHISNSIYILIISQVDMEPENMRRLSVRLFEDVYRILDEQLWVKVDVGIGDCCSNISQVNNSFLQAKAAANTVRKNMAVVHTNHIKQGDHATMYPSKKEKIMCEKIAIGDEQALTILSEILDWITQHYDSLEDFKRKVYELMVIINRAACHEVNFLQNDSSLCFKDIQKINSKGQVKVYVRDMLKRIIEGIGKGRLDRSGVLIGKVCEYIKQNYMKDITLDEMASLAGLSSYYFSKMFKHYQKVNFIDYLTDMRISKAKELLSDPLINIKEISGMVGYSDPNYFTRVFKRLENLTPTEYRNKKMLL